MKQELMPIAADQVPALYAPTDQAATRVLEFFAANLRNANRHRCQKNRRPGAAISAARRASSAPCRRLDAPMPENCDSADQFECLGRPACHSTHSEVRCDFNCRPTKVLHAARNADATRPHSRLSRNATSPPA